MCGESRTLLPVSIRFPVFKSDFKESLQIFIVVHNYKLDCNLSIGLRSKQSSHAEYTSFCMTPNHLSANDNKVNKMRLVFSEHTSLIMMESKC